MSPQWSRTSALGSGGRKGVSFLAAFSEGEAAWVSEMTRKRVFMRAGGADGIVGVAGVAKRGSSRLGGGWWGGGGDGLRRHRHLDAAHAPCPEAASRPRSRDDGWRPRARPFLLAQRVAGVIDDEACRGPTAATRETRGLVPSRAKGPGLRQRGWSRRGITPCSRGGRRLRHGDYKHGGRRQARRGRATPAAPSTSSQSQC